MRAAAAALLLLAPSLRAGMDSEERRSAIEMAGEAVGLVDKSGLSKAELAEMGKRFAEMNHSPQELERAPGRAAELMKAVEREVAGLTEHSRAVDAALEAADEEGYARLLAEREELRRALSKDHDDLVALQKTVRAVWKRSEYAVMAGVLTRQASAKDMLEMDRVKDLHGGMTRSYESARAALARDEQLHLERVSALEARRALRLKVLAGAGAAFLLAPAGLLLWRRRRLPLLLSDTVPVSAEAGGLLAGVYRVDREVGRGAMGVVYEAMDMALNRKVALKRMRDELRREPRELQLLLAEAQAVAALKHPNIVEIYNVLQDRGEVYLVFEFVEGIPLSEAVARQRRLSPPQALGVAGQIAAAVDHAHAQRVIHRDLKPANVMVSPDGRAKVMDFGIAHQAQKTVARLTRASSWGTPAYMAPEQELGQVSKAADVFGLAACCYEMLTGRLPFSGPNFLAQKQALAFAAPSADGLPSAVDEVFRRGLAASPSARFVTAGALVSALQAALKG